MQKTQYSLRHVFFTCKKWAATVGEKLYPKSCPAICCKTPSFPQWICQICRPSTNVALCGFAICGPYLFCGLRICNLCICDLRTSSFFLQTKKLLQVRKYLLLLLTNIACTVMIKLKLERNKENPYKKSTSRTVLKQSCADFIEICGLAIYGTYLSWKCAIFDLRTGTPKKFADLR